MPNEEKVLILTVGLPRSGKSTWAMQQGCPVVNPDSVRLAVHGEAYVKEFEPLVWGVVNAMVRALFIAGHEKVILDATNTTIAARARWVSSLWRTQVKEFLVTTQECITRCGETNRPDLVPVVVRMAAQYEAPAELSRYTG